MNSESSNIISCDGVKIFINKIDSYHGRCISEYLSHCTIGSSKLYQDNNSDADAVLSEAPDFYKVLGTVSSPSSIIKPDIAAIYPDNRDQFFPCVLAADFIIYDISEDPGEMTEAEQIITQLHCQLNNPENLKRRVFILVSSIMTWSETQPLDKNEPDIPFSEEDFRKRKAHSNFQKQLNLERLVTKFGRTNENFLSTYVIACGLTYGMGEGIFNYLFKTAWLNTSGCAIYGDGRNIIPTIHLFDLAQILQNMIDDPPSLHYLLAVDDSNLTFKQIVKAINQVLSDRKIRYLESDSIYLERKLTQSEIDRLSVDLIMEPVYIKEKMNIKWVSLEGIVENIQMIKNEYITCRGLQPIRIFIFGPPASGKTTVAENLACALQLHHIKIKDVIESTVEFIRNFIDDYKSNEKKRALLSYNESDDEDAVIDAADKIKTYQSLLERVEEAQVENNSRLDDSLVSELFQIKLQSKGCQNQGFILDGFPKNLVQAKLLFDNDEELVDDKVLAYKENITPSYIFHLQADDKFLQDRVMNLPECIVSGTHNEMEAYIKRLALFRATNTEADTVLNYFDELEIHPENINITTDKSIAMSDTVDLLLNKLPKGRNFGPTDEELERRQREEMEIKSSQEKLAEQLKRDQEFLEAQEKRVKEDAWLRKRLMIEEEEREMLYVKSAPMRHYLMQNIMPTLCIALQECVQQRPDDPIDFLAEYLFKNNPQEI